MTSTTIEQDGIRITQHLPGNVVIEMGECSITLTEDNADLLRIMLYEAHRSKRWTRTRAEQSARNKLLYSLARAQGKKKPDAHTEKVYKWMQEEAARNTEVLEEAEEMILEIPEFDFLDVELPDFLK